MQFILLPHLGPPLAPTNLTTTNKRRGSVRLLWVFPATEGIEVNFSLIVTNHRMSIVESGIRQLYYDLIVENLSQCDTYILQVIAVNKAGTSNPSEIITRIFVSQPEIFDSLHHSLVKSSEGIMLSVIFNVSYNNNFYYST